MFGKKSDKPRIHWECKFFKNFLKEAPPKLAFYLGLATGVAIFSTISFVLLYGIFFKSFSAAKLAANNLVEQPAAEEAQKAPTPSADEPQEPKADPSKLSPITRSDYVRGNFNAPITMILFTDFQCPYCARHRDTLDQVMAVYKDKVRVVLRNFPLGFHENAQKAAEAAECAGEQGKFWEMHDKLFDMNEAGTLNLENFKKAAADLSLKTDQFNSCLDEGKMAGKVQKDYQEGLSVGVSGTPATFINGNLISGAIPFEQLKSIIDSELKK